jgi:hypothetical protein
MDQSARWLCGAHLKPFSPHSLYLARNSTLSLPQITSGSEASRVLGLKPGILYLSPLGLGDQAHLCLPPWSKQQMESQGQGWGEAETGCREPGESCAL